MKIITTMVFDIIARPGTDLFMLPDDVQFIRLSFFPLNLWQTCAGLYYTVRDPSLSERIHTQTFSETYNRHNPPNDNGQMAAFLLWSEHAHNR